MKAISGKELPKMLETNRLDFAAIRGSHHIYGRSGSEVRISAPIHGNQPLKIGLQRHLTKLAGLI